LLMQILAGGDTPGLGQLMRTGRGRRTGR